MRGRWYVFMMLHLFPTVSILNPYTLYFAHTLIYILVLLLNHNASVMMMDVEHILTFSHYSLSESHTQLGSEESSRALLRPQKRSQKLLQRNHLMISQASTP
jgi:hypothetical protein